MDRYNNKHFDGDGNSFLRVCCSRNQFSISTRLLFTPFLLGPRPEEISTSKTDEGVGDDDDDERKEGRGENSTHDDRRSEEAHNFFAVLRYSISISHEKDGN